MKLNVAIALAILTVTQAFAQAPGGPTPTASAVLGQRSSLAGRRNMGSASGNQNSNPNSLAALHQRIEEMQGTLKSMHSLMTQMNSKISKSGTKDPLVKTNLAMWNLMVGQLEKQLEDLKQTEIAREDMEARRAALYKQAEAKSAAEAEAARRKMIDQTAQAPGNAPSNTSAPSAGVAPATPPTSSPSAN